MTSWDRLLLASQGLPGLAIASGAISGSAVVQAFGSNTDVDTGTVPESIWSSSGLYPWQAAAPFVLEILSADANDTAAGTGARTVQVVGLDANWAIQSVTVTLNGVAAVDLTGTWLRVFSAVVLTSGSGATNAGALTLRLDAAGATQAVVAAATGRSNQAGYTVPAGKTAYLTALRCTGSSVSTLGVFARDNAGSGGFQLREQVVTPGNYEFAVPLVFTEKTDIDVRARTIASDNSTVSATFDLVLVDD